MFYDCLFGLLGPINLYSWSCFGYSFPLQYLMALTLGFLRIWLPFPVLHMQPQELFFYVMAIKSGYFHNCPSEALYLNCYVLVLDLFIFFKA